MEGGGEVGRGCVRQGGQCVLRVGWEVAYSMGESAVAYQFEYPGDNTVGVFGNDDF